MLGGYINQAYDCSPMLQVALPFMYGSKCSPYDNVHASSFSEAERASDLVVMFGNSPAETRMGGANAVWDFAKVRESVTGRGGKIVNIDYRMNESCSGHPDEWLPIRPGTDAALASAIAHEWIANDQVDKGFLDEYCVGYDEDTMPESAKEWNKVLQRTTSGTGYDMVEDRRVVPITGIPAERIKQLAADIAAAEARFITCQGWKRSATRTARTRRAPSACCPCSSARSACPARTPASARPNRPPISWEACRSRIPSRRPSRCTSGSTPWTTAKEMTATNAGIVGADKLNNDIKFLWNYAGNCITNQHGDINYTHDVLADESKLEFILVWDTVMTDSAKYADILLPDAMRSEQLNMQTQGYSEYYTAVVVGGPAQEAPGECRSSYDVCADIADKFGRRTRSPGKTQEDWIKELYEAGAKADGNMPTWDEIKEQGVYKRPLEPAIGLVDFRTDPVKNPLSTPSGKIEIYSEQLAEIAATWELEEGDVINPIPCSPGFQNTGSVTDEYPLYCTRASITRAAPTPPSASSPSWSRWRANSCGSTPPTPSRAASPAATRWP